MLDHIRSYLQAADASVVQTLTGLGPWGLAAIAAYLLGQGLAELAKKVNLAGSGDLSVVLTPEENQRIKEAIGVMGSDLWFTAHPETMDWIKSNPPAETSKAMNWTIDGAVADLDNNLSKLISNCPPEGPERNELCNRVREMMRKVEELREETGQGGTLIDSLFSVAYKWLERRCSSHGLGAAYLKAGLTESEMAQVLSAMLADVAQIPVAEEVQGDFDNYMNAIVDHVSNLAGGTYGMQEVIAYAQSLVADLASNAMLASMGMGNVIVPEEFPKIEDFLAETAVAMDEPDIGVMIADVPAPLQGYGKKDIAALTDEKVMQIANTLEESTRQGGQTDFDEFSAAEVREYLQTKVPEEAYEQPSMIDVIENQDAWTIKELQDLLKQAIEQRNQDPDVTINLNPYELTTKAEILVALRNVLPEPVVTPEEAKTDIMSIRERQQQAFVQVRGYEDAERAAKLSTSPARLWEEWDRQADEILDRAGVRFDSKRERLKERAMGRVVDPNDIDLTQQIHQIPYITRSRMQWMLGRLRSYVGVGIHPQDELLMVHRALQNAHAGWMTEEIRDQIRRLVEGSVAQLGVEGALGVLESEMNRYQREYDEKGSVTV